MTTTSPLRVLVVDDDATYRRILTRVLERLGDVRVSTAGSVHGAIAWLEREEFDAVLLDMVLREESGREVLTWAARHRPAVTPILVTAGGDPTARTTVDAILMGATTLVRKPLGPDAELALTRDVKSALGRVPRRASPSVQPAQAATREVVVIGASTGGPKVLETILSGLAPGFATPIAIVQHMSERQLAPFAGFLTERTGRRVELVQDERPLERAGVYLAGPGRHLVLARRDGRVVCAPGSSIPEHNCVPSVDALFRSAAAACGPRALAVLCTGMGQDGAAGAVALRAGGAPVVIQDRESSVVWGMPGAARAAGAVDAIAPAKELSGWIERWTLPSGGTA